MKKYNGYLFSKLDNIGSKSEGTKYFLQHFDYKEFVVIKQVNLWETDPNLHKFLNKKVSIEGQLTPDGIVYENLKDYEHSDSTSEEESKLEVDLKLETDTLWINKMPGDSHPSQAMDLSLLVKWPYRSIWEGRCPTSQLYEFSIEYNNEVLWKWSDGRVFSQVITPVIIPGGSEFHEFFEVWKISPTDIKCEGTYTAHVFFVASGQEASKDFEIKFAH